MRRVAAPTRDELAAALDVVRRHLDPTPVVRLAGADDVVLKLETWQPTGSFKVRGALVAITSAMADDPTGAIVAASAGNHGLGVAFAADRLGARATVVVPETASSVKVAALERFGVRLLRHGATYDEAEAHALSLAAQHGHFVSPYNDAGVIAGQSTIVPELLAQVPKLTRIVAPVGGGGLVSGLALAVASHRADHVDAGPIEVFGVEAESSRPMAAAVAAGHTVPVAVGATLADGLAGNLEPGSVTVDVVRRHVSALLAVTEDEIAETIRFLVREHGMVAEGSAAVALAALSAGRLPSTTGTTAIVLTGRNIAPATLVDVLSR